MLNNRIVAVVVLTLVAVGAGVSFGVYRNGVQEEISGIILQQPRELTSFNLIDSQNRPFTQQNLQGRWTFLFFGFTRCPMLCPTTLSMLDRMYRRLEKNKTLPIPQVVFVSVDSERDSLLHIGQYATGFNSHFIGVTGEKTQLEQLTKQLSVMYMKVKNENGYTIDHSGTVLLLDPHVRLYAVFATPHDEQKLARDFRWIVSHV